MRDCTCKLGNPPRKTTAKIAECTRHGDTLANFEFDIVNNIEPRPYGLDLPDLGRLYPDTPELNRVSAT